MSKMEATDEDKARIVAVARAAAESIVTLGIAPRDGRDCVVALQVVVLNVIRTVFQEEFQQHALRVLTRQVKEELAGATDSIGPTQGSA